MTLKCLEMVGCVWIEFKYQKVLIRQMRII